MNKKDIYNKYYHSIKGRANYLCKNYKQQDKKRNVGEGDLTAKWILENIMLKPCAHCGKEGWDVIGCNRLDNSKPHTMDNVEPCCFDCNNKLARNEEKTKSLNRSDVSKKAYQYTLDGELVKIWESQSECGRNGFDSSAVCACCKGKLKTHKGYKWSYEPL